MTDRLIDFAISTSLTEHQLFVELDALPEKIVAGVREVVIDQLIEARKWMIDNYLSAAETTDTQLAMRSGALQRAIMVTKREEKDGILARLYVNRGSEAYKYAGTHEFGRTIVPRNRRFLTIPLREELRGVGALEVPGLFVYRARSGGLFLAFRQGAMIRLMYLLVTSVRIPPRPFLRPTADRFFPIIVRQVQAMLTRVVRDMHARLAQQQQQLGGGEDA